MQDLVIYLSDNPDTPPLLATADNAVLPEDVRAVCKDKAVTVVVPSADVLIAQVALPKLSKSRLIQALPFALEEQLIAEVDTLHFAPMAKGEGNYAVCVVAKEKMSQWVARIKEWNIKPEKMLPSCLTLSVNENTWQIVLHDNAADVRIDTFQGFACDRENLQELLQLVITTSENLPQEVIIRNYTAQAFAPEIQLAVNIQEDMLHPAQYVQDLATQQSHFADLNLLQGPFSFKKGKRAPLKNLLYFTGILAAIWVALLFAYPTVSYFLLNKKLAVINTQIAEIYKRNFPTATSIVAPKMRMEEKLHKLSGKSNESRFLNLLSNLSYGLADTSNISLNRFEYQNNQLNVEVNASSSDDVNNFSTILTSKGLTVKQQNANLNGSRVNATLIVE